MLDVWLRFNVIRVTRGKKRLVGKKDLKRVDYRV